MGFFPDGLTTGGFFGCGLMSAGLSLVGFFGATSIGLLGAGSTGFDGGTRTGLVGCTSSERPGEVGRCAGRAFGCGFGRASAG